jgi:Cdc6-like AAA superfamily ATPase
MKSILVAGASRAGKTTLVKKISDEFNFSIIRTDLLLRALGKAYPQLEIRKSKSKDDFLKNLTIFAPFLAHYFNCLALNGIKFVSDTEHFDIEKVMPLMEELQITNEFIFIGLSNNGTSEEIYNSIKKHDTKNDWTYNISDDELKKFCEPYPIINQHYNNMFEKYNFLTYDTSSDRQKIFLKAIEDIKHLVT